MSNITQKWVDLLMPFSNDYSGKLSASELSRATKIPQQTASRILNNLVKKGLIEYVKQGKNKLFYLELKKETARIMLNLIENSKNLKFQLRLKEISIIINEILNYCESIIVFGSYASYESNKDSDLDLVILGKSAPKKIKKAKEKYFKEINEHYISYGEFYKLIKTRNALAIEILKKHVFFGDVSKIVEAILRRENERR